MTGSNQSRKDAVFMTAEEVQDVYGIDPVTAETVRAGLIEVTRHMFRTLKRSAFSNVVRDLLDFGVCLHLPTDEGTEMVAITEGCTHFAFTQPHMANFVLDEWGLENLNPGDTLICNDPWRGSIHLGDINLLRPVFWEGEPIFLLSDAAHLLDIGGPVAGGFNNQATEFFAEGLRIPPMLVTSGDVPVRSTINLLLENTRTPLHNLGDLRALFGTMRVGEGRVMRLLETHGPDAVVGGAKYTLDLAERRMRAAISSVEDGVYEAEEWIDDDGVGTDPVRLFVSGRVAGDHVEIDFSGSDAQPLGSLTSCWEETGRVLLGPKMILDPLHPMNSGAMRPFHVLAATGSVVMGTPPTSSSQHAEIATKIAPLSLQLVSRMVPERAVAADGGTTHAHILGGIDQRPGREGMPFGAGCTQGIGWGGTTDADGISFCSTPIFGISSSVIEFLERDTPVIVRSTNGVIDSAGPGRYRSGYGNSILLECSKGEVFVSTILDSGRFVRPGAEGGGDGMTSYLFRAAMDEGHRIPQSNGLVPADHLTRLAGRFDVDGRPDSENGEWGLGSEYQTTKLTNLVLGEGEVLLVLAPSGGGYGDPFTRDVELVRLDVWNEKLSTEAAARHYGVVIDGDTGQVDVEATHALRAGRPAGSARPVAGYRPWPMTVSDLPSDLASRTATR